MVKHAFQQIRNVRLSISALVVASLVAAAAGSVGMVARTTSLLMPSCTVGSPLVTASIEFRGLQAKQACAELVRQHPDLKPKSPAGQVLCDFSRNGVDVVIRDSGWDQRDGRYTCWALGAPGFEGGIS
jgi:hypothetical protein